MLRSARLFLPAFLALVLCALPVSAQDGVSGKWVVTLNSPEMGQINMEFDLQQTGSEVTGSASLPIPEIEGTHLTDGLFEDGVLSFLLHVGMQGQWYAVEVEADVDGDEMVGEAYMAEMGMVTPFTGKRATGS
jgi:hypothetical protein